MRKHSTVYGSPVGHQIIYPNRNSLSGFRSTTLRAGSRICQYFFLHFGFGAAEFIYARFGSVISSVYPPGVMVTLIQCCGTTTKSFWRRITLQLRAASTWSAGRAQYGPQPRRWVYCITPAQRRMGGDWPVDLSYPDRHVRWTRHSSEVCSGARTTW